MRVDPSQISNLRSEISDLKSKKVVGVEDKLTKEEIAKTAQERASQFPLWQIHIRIPPHRNSASERKLK
jgi:hypothetical protein